MPLDLAACDGGGTDRKKKINSKKKKDGEKERGKRWQGPSLSFLRPAARKRKKGGGKLLTAQAPVSSSLPPSGSRLLEGKKKGRPRQGKEGGRERRNRQGVPLFLVSFFPPDAGTATVTGGNEKKKEGKKKSLSGKKKTDGEVCPSLLPFSLAEQALREGRRGKEKKEKKGN